MAFVSPFTFAISRFVSHTTDRLRPDVHRLSTSRHRAPTVRRGGPVPTKTTEMTLTSLETERDSGVTHNNLLIIGAGVLGREIAKVWRARFPEARIIGETLSDKSHDELRSLGIEPVMAEDNFAIPSDVGYVVFCAPPGGNDNYPQSVYSAVTRANIKETTRFIFTSSIGIQQGNHVDESAPVNTSSERSLRLIKAEEHVLSHPNALVVRLAGLYTLTRGPHTFWLRMGKINGSRYGTINLIHYQDVAHGVVQALLVDDQLVKQWPRRTLLLSTNELISRLACCEATLRHPLYKGKEMPTFSMSEDDDDKQKEEVMKNNKTYNNDWTREVLDWKPQWESFSHFIDDDMTRN